MNLVDSSAWLEYLAGGANAGYFASAIEEVGDLAVPTVCLYEVFKRIAQQRSENEALQAVAAMRQGHVVELDGEIALRAARLSIELKLPFADSVILATAREHDTTLWTQDSHFERITGVKFRAAPPRGS